MRLIDADALADKLEQIISDYISHGMYLSDFDIRYAIDMVEAMPTLTPPTIGHCKDCDNWDEEFSAGRKSLNNYVCYCSEWSDPEIGYERYTRPDDYCSYFEPKEGMEDGKND